MKHVIGSIAILALILSVSGCPEEPAEAPAAEPTAAADKAPDAAKKPGLAEPPAAPAAELKGGDMVTVKKVIKGDALLVEKDGKQATVRMLGIDSFHKKITDKEMTEVHKNVVAHLEKELLGKPVQVVLDKKIKDDRGRYLATVMAGITDINKQLIAKGFVLTYSEFGFDKEEDYLQVEREARKKGENIWASARLSRLATERRRSWAEARKARGEKIPEYYFMVIAAEADEKADTELKPEEKAKPEK